MRQRSGQAGARDPDNYRGMKHNFLIINNKLRKIEIIIVKPLA